MRINRSGQAQREGTACHWIRKKLRGQGQAIYLGDGRTDEEAFAVLDDAVTIKVGGDPAKTLAQYHVPGPAEVREFLHWLAAYPAHTPEAMATHA